MRSWVRKRSRHLSTVWGSATALLSRPSAHSSLKSRHYVPKFLARRGLVYREGPNWMGKHFAWLRAIERDEVLEGGGPPGLQRVSGCCWTTSWTAATSCTARSRCQTGRREPVRHYMGNANNPRDASSIVTNWARGRCWELAYRGRR